MKKYQKKKIKVIAKKTEEAKEERGELVKIKKEKNNPVNKNKLKLKKARSDKCMSLMIM